MNTDATNIPDYQTKKWQDEWAAISDAEGGVDLRKAVIAREVRKVFPRGAVGDVQFCLYVSAKFDNCHADVMLLKARSWDDFSEADWRRFRGWSGIQYLLRLTKSQRRQLLALMPGRGPYGIRKIKRHAGSLGIQPPPLGFGRPTQTETEARFRIVADCLVDAFNKHRESIPEEVLAALPKAVRARVASKIRTRA